MKSSAKKGSLQLSVNAIVVLVLAITMLGIGIKFTRDMMSRAGDDLLGVDIDTIPEPTPNDWVTFESKSLRVDSRGQSAIGLKMINVLNDPVKVSIYSESCGSTSLTSKSGIFYRNVDDSGDALSKPIVTGLAAGEKFEYAIGIDPEKNVKPPGATSGSKSALVSTGGMEICDLVVQLDLVSGGSTGPEKTYRTSLTLTAK